MENKRKSLSSSQKIHTITFRLARNKFAPLEFDQKFRNNKKKRVIHTVGWFARFNIRSYISISFTGKA